MSVELPAGEPETALSSRIADAFAASSGSDFGVYVHVPFCASRCGYCDFNTYTAPDLGGGVSRDTYVTVLAQEFARAAEICGDTVPKASTIFIGGGTPTLLPAADLASIVELVESTFGLQNDVEITTEANPETVDEHYFRRLRDNGFTRVSLGMQSSSSKVLAVLERQHTPGRAREAAALAKKAGFAHVNLDLIYGTPGETADDFAASLRDVRESGADHVSAYSLIVEEGTRLANQVKRGTVPQPSDDEAADRYLAAEEDLTRTGFEWYEVSNWALNEPAQCRHNLLYWKGQNWWGFGPGAHSHAGGVRWGNVKHPATYGARLSQKQLPAGQHEVLTEEQRYDEDVMLRLRLREGLALSTLDSRGAQVAERLAADGLLDRALLDEGRVSLTLRGRLLADVAIRDLLV
ncbi:MAG TPA: radical SAM family heme chaperone HemW [Candidatus Stackebrandtia faecavium]|nr:radical SAM family heme chaperone HemW [Candidatus Stackebrandtia faecavium]